MLYFVKYGQPGIVIFENEDEEVCKGVAKRLTKQSPYKHWVEPATPAKTPSKRKTKDEGQEKESEDA